MASRILTLCLLVAACFSQPRPLSYADLALEGLAFEVDTADATRHFGAPDSVRTLPRRAPFAADGSNTVPLLHFPGLTLLFGEDGLLSGFDISAPPHRTIRGLAVGTDSGTVEQLYGTPRARDAAVWLYSSEDGRIDMALRFENGRVVSITLGTTDLAPAR